MKQCANLKKNRARCPCTYEPCERKGMCCECIRYHLSSGELPACAFPKGVEAGYDRSFAKFSESRR